MLVISTSEFATNQNKYFDMALKEQVFVQRGNNMFHLMCANKDNATVKERVYYEPDEDFNRSISMEEFKKRALIMVEKIYQIRYIGNNHTIAQYL